MKTPMKAAIIAACLCFLATAAAGGNEPRHAPVVSGKDPPAADSGSVLTEEGERERKVEPYLGTGSLELSTSVVRYASRTESGESATLPRLTFGVHVLPYVQVEVASRPWSFTSMQGLFTGRLSLYFRTRVQGAVDLIPYVFGGLGLGVNGPIDDDSYEVDTVGGGLKTFFWENLALRLEYGAAYYSEAWGWFTSSTNDKTISLGVSLFRLR